MPHEIFNERANLTGHESGSIEKQMKITGHWSRPVTP